MADGKDQEIGSNLGSVGSLQAIFLTVSANCLDCGSAVHDPTLCDQGAQSGSHIVTENGTPGIRQAISTDQSFVGNLGRTLCEQFRKSSGRSGKSVILPAETFIRCAGSFVP